MSNHISKKIIGVLTILSMSVGVACADSDCDATLVRATSSDTSSVHSDYRLSVLVTSDDWSNAQTKGGANALLYDIPIGASYSEYRENSQKALSDTQTSITIDEARSQAWSGLDHQVDNLYSLCQKNKTFNSNGLHAIIEYATKTAVSVLVRWSVPNDPKDAIIDWQPAELASRWPKTLVAGGEATIIVPRPKIGEPSIVFVANYNGYTTGALEILPVLPDPPPLPDICQPVDMKDQDRGHESGRGSVDFNGDKCTDYCRIVGNKGGDYYALCTIAKKSKAQYNIKSSPLDPGFDQKRFWVDMNGDGRADFCRINSGNNKMLCTLSAGESFGSVTESGKIDPGWGGTGSWRDVNGDGIPDFCRSVDSGHTTVEKCAISDGHGGFNEKISN